ncbi:hypothetical protein HYV71_04255 [Candidatus Uhrbacteria bacterium]|nr:hypothetical protein [Candidatus Uhrbacteria bacterium]
MSNKRSKVGQKKHDESVRKTADWYKNQGFTVKADLPGQIKPKKIGGFVPDVIAKKGKKEVIVEVETKKTASADKEQQQAFRDYANRKNSRVFRKKIAK